MIKQTAVLSVVTLLPAIFYLTSINK